MTSFINSETTALLHLMSFTEDVTNIGFHMPIVLSEIQANVHHSDM